MGNEPAKFVGWWTYGRTLHHEICVDAAILETSRKAAEEKKKNCSKNEVRKEGSKWIQDSVCKAGGSTITTQSTTEFNGDNAYHLDVNATFDPPMRGLSRSHIVKDNKWLGPCK